MNRRRSVLRWALALSVGVVLPALVGLSDLSMPVLKATSPYYSYPCPFIAQGRDFDGDGADVGATWNPRTGLWSTPQNGTGGTWGAWGDYPANGDYNNDGSSDLAVWRASNGTWYVKCSSTTNCPGGDISFPLGTAGDIPVPADYDNDGYTDYGVWRPSTGYWYVMSGANRTTLLANTQWGAYGDCPIPAKLVGSGPGELQLNVWRPANGVWYMGRTLAGTGGMSVQWGSYGDIPFAFDADVDGDDDQVVWRPTNGTWYGNEPVFTIQWGTAGDIPTVSKGDFGSPTTVALNVWRPTTRLFYACAGNDGLSGTTCFESGVWTGAPIGSTGDVPVGGRIR